MRSRALQDTAVKTAWSPLSWSRWEAWFWCWYPHGTSYIHCLLFALPVGVDFLLAPMCTSPFVYCVWCLGTSVGAQTGCFPRPRSLAVMMEQKAALWADVPGAGTSVQEACLGDNHHLATRWIRWTNKAIFLSRNAPQAQHHETPNKHSKQLRMQLQQRLQGQQVTVTRPFRFARFLFCFQTVFFSSCQLSVSLN